jgi:hypothetical protein
VGNCLHHDPALATIRGTPEFKAVFAIEHDMTVQRARLAARPDVASIDPTGSR